MSSGVGRLFNIGFEGLSVPDRVSAFADEFGLGGVILFARNCPSPEAVSALAKEVHALATQPPLVMIDQEGGRVERLRTGVPRLPAAASMAALGEEGVEELAFEQSRALGALGIDVNLAPVCDVVRPGESGAIGDRAWGTTGANAAQGARAFYRGMRRGGMIGCAKHFPGHGASSVDTHLGAGVVDLSESELFSTDVPPFGALIEEGIEMVMACHLSYPNVDPEPACFSRRWLDGILRGRLGFGGVVITDDMEMGAVRVAADPAETAAKAVLAGADMLIYGHMLDPDLDLAALARRLAAALPGDRVEASARRIAALRRRDDSR